MSIDLLANETKTITVEHDGVNYECECEIETEVTRNWVPYEHFGLRGESQVVEETRRLSHCYPRTAAGYVDDKRVQRQCAAACRAELGLE